MVNNWQKTDTWYVKQVSYYHVQEKGTRTYNIPSKPQHKIEIKVIETDATEQTNI